MQTSAETFINSTDTNHNHSAVETTVWNGRPSQIVNFFWYLFCFVMLAALLVAAILALDFYDYTAEPYSTYIVAGLVCFPIIYAFYRYLLVRFEIKVITTERIRIRKSIWNSGMRPLELFRVKDHDYDEPWYWKPFGLGTVKLVTSDHSDPDVKIRAIRHAKELHDVIARLVKQERRRQGVQEIDYK